MMPRCPARAPSQPSDAGADYHPDQHPHCATSRLGPRCCCRQDYLFGDPIVRAQWCPSGGAMVCTGGGAYDLALWSARFVCE